MQCDVKCRSGATGRVIRIIVGVLDELKQEMSGLVVQLVGNTNSVNHPSYYRGQIV